MKGNGALSLAVLLSATLASADPRVGVVGAGACRDADLAAAVRGLSVPLSRESSVRLVPEEALFARLGRGPARSPDELARGLEAARQLFLAGRHVEALGQLETLQAEISRLAPGAQRWSLWSSAAVLEGVVRTRVKGSTDPEDAFFRVLRLDPGLQLERDDYGPATIARFERVRVEVQKSKRAPLRVKSQPPGADVFLDGRRVGATPYSGEHVPGRYQLVVAKGENVSLPRRVDVGPATVQVDLRFESTVETALMPCLAQESDEAVRLGTAVRLGAALELDQLVVLRIERGDAGPTWLSATVVDIPEGRKVRDGGLGLGPKGVGEAELLKLAKFVATGENAELAALPVAPVQPPVVEPPAVALTNDEASERWRRPAGQITTAAGSAVLIAGAVMTGLGVGAEMEYRKLTRNGLEPKDAPAARRAADRSALFLPVGIGGMAVGALTGAAGAWLWSSAPQTAPRVSVTVPLTASGSPGARDGMGAAISVSGRF